MVAVLSSGFVGVAVFEVHPSVAAKLQNMTQISKDDISGRVTMGTASISVGRLALAESSNAYAGYSIVAKQTKMLDGIVCPDDMPPSLPNAASFLTGRDWSPVYVEILAEFAAKICVLR